MKRVLHIAGAMNVGGAESRLLQLLEAARAERLHFTFACFDDAPGQLDQQAQDSGGEFVSLGRAGHPWTARQRLLTIIREGQYDVLHAHLHYFSGICVEAAHRAGVPSRIVHLRTTSDGQADTGGRLLYRRAMRWAIERYSTQIVAVSVDAMERFSGPSWSSDPRKRVIYNGFDFSKFEGRNERAEVRAEFGMPRDSSLAIHVGRFTPEKNHRHLLEVITAASLVQPSLRWLCVGDGAERASFEAACFARGLGEIVKLAGVRRDVARLLKAADVFVFPSRFEGLPGATIEALAAGLPVVASDLPSIREIAAACGGIALCPIDDTDAFTRSALAAVRGGWRHPLRTRDLREQFSMATYLQHVADIYECQGAFGV